MNTFSRLRMKKSFSLWRNYHKVSQFIPPIHTTDIINRTFERTNLMADYGLIRRSSNGIYYLMPMALRALNKLTRLIDKSMTEIDAQKMEMPYLFPQNLWETCGRWDEMGKDMYKLKDRQDNLFCLAPTHEEAVTSLIASFGPISHRKLPIKLYQTTTKFRDEMQPCNGLFRGKQLLMKDLYTFDQSVESALNTYNQVGEAYSRLFQSLGLNAQRVDAANSLMGGTLSHEYHIITNFGEDKLAICPRGDYAANADLLGDEEFDCPKCETQLEIQRGLEIAHTFLLGDKYSRAFNANFSKDQTTEALQMGCYGLGVTRILATIVEVFSQENQIRWPESIAPYLTCLIPPKSGSKEATVGDGVTQRILHQLSSIENWKDELVLDDRDNLTIGMRLNEAKRIGYPYIVVVGKQVMSENRQVELHHLTSGSMKLMNVEQLVQYLTNLEGSKEDEKLSLSL